MPSGSKLEWLSDEIGTAKQYEHLHCKHKEVQEVCEALRHSELSSAKACEEQKSERGRAWCLVMMSVSPPVKMSWDN